MSINRKAIFDHHQKSLTFEMAKKRSRAQELQRRLKILNLILKTVVQLIMSLTSLEKDL